METAVIDARSGYPLPTAIATKRFRFFGRTMKKAQRNHKWDALRIVMMAPEIQVLSFLERGSMIGEKTGRVK